MSTSAFFSSDDAVTRTLECQTITTSEDDLTKVYNIEQCTQWILASNFSSVALQFPNNLLVDAPKVARLIQDQVSSSVFILGDTSYGSCCVDEVGAQHYKADCIIHYGSACLSPTSRLPVLYVFGRSPLDVEDCVAKICQQYSDTAMKAVLAYDTKYAFLVNQVFQQLQTCLPQLVLSKMLVPSCGVQNQDSSYQTIYPESIHIIKENEKAQSASSVIQCGRMIPLSEGDDIDDYSFVFLGDTNCPTVINLMMNFNKSPFYAYDPMTRVYDRITLNVNRALMKRYYLIERAKDAGIVGILVGTLGVAKYRDIMDQLKALLKKAGKKSYTFVVGKLNPQKLGNFGEVEVFVLVSCPESCLFDQSDFHCPVVSPFEMEVACNKAREWTGDYTTDFSTLLPGSSKYVQAPDACYEEEEGDVSLISNRLRIIGERKAPEPASSSTDVVLRSEALAVSAAAENAGEFLSMRSWKGLEQNLGQTPVVKAAQGQSGIAASYKNEHIL